MLRAKHIVHLQTALCLWALISAYFSLVIYRVLAEIAIPRSMSNLANGLASVQDFETVKRVCVAMVDASIGVRDNGTVLAWWGLVFVCGWSLIMGVTAALLYRQVQSGGDQPMPPVADTVVDRALAGKIELWKAYWGLHVGLTLVLGLLINGLLGLWPRDGGSAPMRVFNLVIWPIIIALPATVFLLTAFAVWRCAANTSHVAWQVLARVAIAISVLMAVAKSFVAFGVLNSH